MLYLIYFCYARERLQGKGWRENKPPQAGQTKETMQFCQSFPSRLFMAPTYNLLTAANVWWSSVFCVLFFLPFFGVVNKPHKSQYFVIFLHSIPTELFSQLQSLKIRRLASFIKCGNAGFEALKLGNTRSGGAKSRSFSFHCLHGIALPNPTRFLFKYR